MTLVAPSTAPFTISAPAGPPAPPARSLSVMLLGVTPAEAARLRWVLEATGCDVTGRDEQAVPDVVIVGEGGIDAAREVAGRAKLRQPFVIAVTAPGGEPKARAAGVHLTLPRPLDLARLAGMLARFRSLLAGVEGFDPVI